jgi:hypothetical protein
LSDATRENRASTIEYLSSIINESIIRDHCTNYHEGILKKGIAQAFGTFHKELTDLSIVVKNTDASQLVHLLGNLESNTSNSTYGQDFSTRSLSVFLQTQELYLYKVVTKLFEVAHQASLSYSQKYRDLSQYCFIAFVFFQVFVLVYLRGRLLAVLREEVYKSRGILNLIPDEVFQ